MRNRYSPPESQVGDGPPPNRRLRMFWLCAVTGAVTTFALIVGLLLAVGESVTGLIVLGLTIITIPLSALSGAVIAQFRTVRAYAGAAACSLITLVGTVAICLLAADR
ncbi:MAG TPA: hypothetical protein VGQ22_24085 [Steroidobacteraceae bacterium]|jgi:hypothetical protein|nr:hypothetical protein [Steroidobacteraceae bacterium]